MTLKDLREIVCTKRCLPTESYGFQTSAGHSNSSFLALDMKLSEFASRGVLRLEERVYHS